MPRLSFPSSSQRSRNQRLPLRHRVIAVTEERHGDLLQKALCPGWWQFIAAVCCYRLGSLRFTPPRRAPVTGVTPPDL